MSRSRLGLGQLRLVPKTNFRPNCAVTLIKRTQYERALDAGGSEALTFSYQISALSKFCYYHIRELRCLRFYLDFKTFSTIATSIVHSKLDYFNFYSTVSDKKTPEHPDLICSFCYKNAKIFSHHPCSEISARAENKQTH